MLEKIELWVHKIKQGDRDAFEKLFLKFYEPLCKFTYRFVRSSHISEELVQEVYLDVWESKEALDPKKNIKSFLYQSVRNKALNYKKHQKVAEEHNPEIEWLNQSPARQSHSYEEEPNFEQAVKQAVEDLPEGARIIYKMSRNDGLTYKEIAQVLDISPKTVESQISRALKKLRHQLKDYSFPPDLRVINF